MINDLNLILFKIIFLRLSIIEKQLSHFCVRTAQSLDNIKRYKATELTNFTLYRQNNI